jgi:glucokinase
MLIAGDIGGTKTDLAIFSVEAGPHNPLAQETVRSANYPSLQAMVKEFLAKVKMPVDRACFDVAGPVIGGRVKTTNLPWIVEETALAKELNLSSQAVHLMNDLEAIARAIPILRPSDLKTLNTGRPIPKGAIGVVAPGTGLGESFLTWEGARYVAHSSEGGHSDFAPTDQRQLRLLEYLLPRLDHVSFELVCSGIGIPNIYEYLRDVEQIPENPVVAEKVAAAADRSVVIINAAFDQVTPSKLCETTIEVFASVLADEAGNLALKVLSTGGVYLGGGVVVHTLPMLERPLFMKYFKRKGRFAELLERIPIHVITTRAALVGVADYGLASTMRTAAAV